MKRTIVFAFGLIVGFGLVSYEAFAIRNNDSNYRTIQTEMRGNNAAKIVGTLSCHMAEVNAGQACTLKVKEAETGKFYKLGNADQAMKLFNEGARNVRIEGTIRNGDIIDIASIAGQVTN